MENCSIKPTELSHCQFTELHHLPKGSFLYQQGESAHEFYYVQAGLVGLFHTLETVSYTHLLSSDILCQQY